jgi:hypothetical protein
MPKARQSTREPFVEVDYEDKIVFTPKPNGQARPALRATWQQSQGLGPTTRSFTVCPFAT